MRILVFNAGSSSLKFSVFDLAMKDSRIFKGEYEQFADGACVLHYRHGETAGELQRNETGGSILEVIRKVPALLAEFGLNTFAAVGHRVVHGGEEFRAATLVDDKVMQKLAACSVLAPLHNPVSQDVIKLSWQLWPDLPQVAVFDTAFHQTIPDYAHTYAVPKAWRDKGLRRYGFHGTSHHYVAQHVAKHLQQPLNTLRIISCHLGNGASVCAINHGQSVDTSMGMTPMEGLVMGTRAGDVDPGIFAFLQRELGLGIDAVENALNNFSGLYALAGTADLRLIETRAAAGDAEAQLAIHVYAYRVRKYIGAYAAAMGGLDVVVFTGGIGENSAAMRRRICERLEFLGLYLDDDRNRVPELDDFAAPQLQAIDSRVRVIVTRTNEQFMIAQEVRQLLDTRLQIPTMPHHIRIAVSARHVHLSHDAVAQLFGPGHELTLDHVLGQKDGWAAVETVELIGPHGSFQKVRVLGPPRAATQIEISRTDTFALGLDAPLRPSGMLQDTPVVRLRGPYGEIATDGLIVAARHIHMNTADAVKFGLKDGDYVEMKFGAGQRAVVFSHTLIRVKDTYATEMHIDTDEANAAGIAYCTEGELVTMPEQHDAGVGPLQHRPAE